MASSRQFIAALVPPWFRIRNVYSLLPIFDSVQRRLTEGTVGRLCLSFKGLRAARTHVLGAVNVADFDFRRTGHIAVRGGASYTVRLQCLLVLEVVCSF